MSTKLDIPRRSEPIIDNDRSPTRRLSEFFESIPGIADTQSALTIIWTTNEPTASTTMTIADGSNPTATETGQAIKNLNEQFNALIAELKSAGVVSS
jgi:hypothetical protein